MKRKWMPVAMLPIFTLAVFGPAAARAATNYVARSGQAPASPYLTWATAASNIQEAVNAASSGNTVLVDDGVYTLTNQITLSRRVTLKSVNGAAATIIDGNYPCATNRCLKYSQDINSTVDGFTIRNGYFLIPSGAPGDVEGEYGGGGVSMFGDGVLRNCVIASNTCVNPDAAEGVHGGGGIFMNRRSAIVSNCIIRGNRYIGAGKGGGGIYMFAADNARMIDCTLEGNDAATTGGGGAFLWGGTVSNCVFATNTAKSGGGLSQTGAPKPQRNCTFVGNRAGDGGGASILGGWFVDCAFLNNVATNTYGGGVAFSYGGSASNCLFYGNVCAGEGGGFTTIKIVGYAPSQIHNCRVIANQAVKGGGGAKAIYEGRYRNCLFLNNTNTSATGGGGGLLASFMSGYPSTGPIGLGYADNLTLAGNQSGGLGGGLHVYAFAPNFSSNLLHNTIIYGNVSTGDAYEDVRVEGANTNAFFFCCTSVPLVPNQGNIVGDPRYVDLAGGDVRLKGGSPCVNAGVNQDWMAAALDLAGKPRLDRASGRVDMGAYEHVPSGSCFQVR